MAIEKCFFCTYQGDSDNLAQPCSFHRANPDPETHAAPESEETVIRRRLAELEAGENEDATSELEAIRARLAELEQEEAEAKRPYEAPTMTERPVDPVEDGELLALVPPKV